MTVNSTTISLAIALVSAVIAIATIVNIILRIRNSKNITIKKKTGETITFSKTYNREQSKKLLEFMK